MRKCDAGWFGCGSSVPLGSAPLSSVTAASPGADYTSYGKIFTLLPPSPPPPSPPKAPLPPKAPSPPSPPPGVTYELRLTEVEGPNLNGVQLAEVRFFDSGGSQVPVTAVSNPGGSDASSNQGPHALVDGVIGTDASGRNNKWYSPFDDQTHAAVLQLDRTRTRTRARTRTLILPLILTLTLTLTLTRRCSSTWRWGPR